MRTELLQHIAQRNVLSFIFRGSLFTVEPHAYGETVTGEEVLRCFQIGGDDSSNSWGWKLIPVAEIAIFDVLAQRFSGARDGYAVGDRGMVRIFGQIAQGLVATDGAHTTEDDYQHFLSYSRLDHSDLMRYAYFHGANADCEKPSVPSAIGTTKEKS